MSLWKVSYWRFAINWRSNFILWFLSYKRGGGGGLVKKGLCTLVLDAVLGLKSIIFSYKSTLFELNSDQTSSLQSWLSQQDWMTNMLALVPEGKLVTPDLTVWSYPGISCHLDYHPRYCRWHHHRHQNCQHKLLEDLLTNASQLQQIKLQMWSLQKD